MSLPMPPPCTRAPRATGKSLFVPEIDEGCRMSMPLLPSRQRRPVAAVLAALLGTCCLSAHAQDDSIATDRPDFVESSSVVGKGRFQIETGFARETDRDGDRRTRVSTTPTLLRMGLGETWELRVETDGYARIRSEDRALAASERIQGMSDLALGVKWHMQDASDSG